MGHPVFEYGWVLFYFDEWPRNCPFLTYYLRHRASLNHHHQGRKEREKGFPCLLSSAHGRTSELLRRTALGRLHAHAGKLQLPPSLARPLSRSLGSSWICFRHRSGGGEREVRSLAASKQPFLTISAEEGGRALCCHVRHCGCITCGGSVD